MSASVRSLGLRVADLDWTRMEAELDARGWTTTGALLAKSECDALTSLYDDDRLFRSRVIMARHGFGRGEYRYFDYPLPSQIQTLRDALYARLAPVANRWRAGLGLADPFPAQHLDYINRCHAAGQTKPTPLILRYGAGDFNCLHQDRYGEHLFPLQAAFLLAKPGQDFEGGAFVLTEQRPRLQSRANVVPLDQGEAVIFAVSQRPVAGTRGTYRVSMRHGVSEVLAGQRHTLGIIFHDAN